MKCWPHRHHQLQLSGYRCQSCGCGPGVQRWRFRALNVIEIEFSNEGEIEANLLTAPGKMADIVPACLHVFVFHVPQPAAKDRKPISVTHYAASVSRNSASLVKGLNPITRGPSATKLERALMS